MKVGVSEKKERDFERGVFFGGEVGDLAGVRVGIGVRNGAVE